MGRALVLFGGGLTLSIVMKDSASKIGWRIVSFSLYKLETALGTLLCDNRIYYFPQQNLHRIPPMLH